jgi:hypothetical protein
MDEHQISVESRGLLNEAVQILETFPEWLRPESDMEDMRQLSSSGLVDLDDGRAVHILVTALTTVLAHMAWHPPNFSDPEQQRTLGDRWRRLSEIFDKLGRSTRAGHAFDTACWRQHAAFFNEGGRRA